MLARKVLARLAGALALALLSLQVSYGQEQTICAQGRPQWPHPGPLSRVPTPKATARVPTPKATARPLPC